MWDGFQPPHKSKLCLSEISVMNNSFSKGKVNIQIVWLEEKMKTEVYNEKFGIVRNKSIAIHFKKRINLTENEIEKVNLLAYEYSFEY